MKLIHDIIIRRLDVMKDLELNHENFKSIWHFYQVYQICINILGKKDTLLKKKLYLLRNLIINPENLNSLDKLRRYMAQDSKVIELVLTTLEENNEIQEVFEDFYPDSVFAVNIDDRGS